MSSYSCLSCRVSFIDSELQRNHYKSDWHRYNLKRKVAELPPITRELFTEKLAQQKSQAEDEKKDTSKFCNVCSKSFSNMNAYTNHMNSKKHKIIKSKNGAKASVTQNATDDNEEDSKNSPGKALASNSADAMVYF